MPAFGDLLGVYLDKRGLSDNEFAKRSRTTQTTVSQVKTGMRSPPLKSVEKWAKYLELEGEEEERFMLLANQERAQRQKRSAPYLVELQAQRDELVSLVDVLVEMLRGEGVKIPDDLTQRLEILKKTT